MESADNPGRAVAREQRTTLARRTGAAQRGDRRVTIIRDFDFEPCTMRKEDPNWRFALGASPVSEGHILRIATADGVEGFGYASAVPHMGSIQGSLKAELELFR